ncbi:MAG TPA: ABC transporter ATP-binding protein [Candidatus Krumholzibacteria bacterium]|nr:ABC transporter ATP-binding protein [Candidatus Krumholzibacteria bacterium]HPD72248.1 ABC transporter ATP-binding protein [Candidatus Krumholzibacteria bacterium]HRY40820.1 ABC transporter ATP-binding protein [Candidatus Krumholzibacteria bacterium]
MRTTWTTLRPYWSLLEGQGRILTVVIALMLVATAISLAVPVQAGRFVDVLTRGRGLGADPRAMVVLGALLVAQLVGNFLFQYLSARLGLETVTRLRRRLFAHLLGLPSLYFTDMKAGDLSSRVTSDVGNIQYLLTSGVVSFIRAVVTFIGALILMVQLNVRLTLVVLLVVPSTILLVSFFGRHLRRLSRRMYDDLGELSNHVQEVAGAIRAIKVFGSQDHEQRRFDGRLAGFQAAGVRRALLSSALDSGAQILLWICLITIVVYGFYLTSQGRASYGELVTFMLLAFRVATPMGALTGLYASAQSAVAAAGRLDDVFRSPPETVALAGPGTRARTTVTAPAAPIASRGLRAEALCFRYDVDADSPWTLQDVSFVLAPNERLALVGPSGAGKTTLAGLILRLFDPQGGRLVLDGLPYPDHDLRQLRSRMAYVPQDAVLYDASVADNIRFGLDDATDQAVRQAAARAQALDFVERLPGGFAARVGDRGVRLSGGERQRLALARAFLRNPDILVLDEPTSALDAASEAAVRGAIAELMQGRSTIVIAHRLSLVRDLDRILVLDGGRVTEVGSHRDLLALGGLYANLYALQQGSRGTSS